jgi:hypothetical protein
MLRVGTGAWNIFLDSVKRNRHRLSRLADVIWP